jgi:hypothetical protein
MHRFFSGAFSPLCEPSLAIWFMLTIATLSAADPAFLLAPGFWLLSPDTCPNND